VFPVLVKSRQPLLPTSSNDLRQKLKRCCENTYKWRLSNFEKYGRHGVEQIWKGSETQMCVRTFSINLVHKQDYVEAMEIFQDQAPFGLTLALEQVSSTWRSKMNSSEKCHENAQAPSTGFDQLSSDRIETGGDSIQQSAGERSHLRSDTHSVVWSSYDNAFVMQLSNCASNAGRASEELAAKICDKGLVGVRVAVIVKIENQGCDDVGIKVLCGFLSSLFISCLAHTRAIIAWKNDIGDTGCTALGELLHLQGQYCNGSATHIRELHLAHNRISVRGALILRDACKIYPYRSGSGTAIPLWLHLDQNCIDINAFKNTPGSHFCWAVSNCSITVCTQKQPPSLHLPNFKEQRDPLSYFFPGQQQHDNHYTQQKQNEPKSKCALTAASKPTLHPHGTALHELEPGWKLSTARSAKRPDADTGQYLMCFFFFIFLQWYSGNPPLFKYTSNLLTPSAVMACVFPFVQ